MNTKQQKINSYNPNGLAAADANIYGLPFNAEEAEIIILPLPWDVTVSYNDGTCYGPESIFEASKQVDLYDAAVANAWKIGLHMLPINESWKKTSEETRVLAKKIIEDLENGSENEETNNLLTHVNNTCSKFHQEVEQAALNILNNNKIIVGLGGDHSTPYGIIKALATKHNSFAILQFDAHCDLRDAYEGFTYSHASIMFNVLNDVPQVTKLVQVGIRDYCEDEKNLIENSNGRIVTFFDRYIKQQSFAGKTFADFATEVIATLPQHIYISFDIDALDPKLCPNTGTPVAGGLELEQAYFMIEEIVKAGKIIIAADVNEVSPAEDSDWDANVGARLLFRLSNLIAKSNNLI
jgi:agmatinase